MDAYVDSSVLLRIILGEPDQLGSWASIDRAVSSELLRLECLRTIDRARLRMRLEDDAVSRYRAEVIEACDAMNVVPLGRDVLERASEPFPTTLGSLDAIHLASAILVRHRFEQLVMATHDTELALAARAEGFEVHG